ncbi:MAG: hypothetical protein ACXWL2_03770 [Candidatus Chromulinivorax sp.]
MNKTYYLFLCILLQVTCIESTKTETSLNYKKRKLTATEFDSLVALTNPAGKEAIKKNDSFWYSSHTNGKSTGRTADDLAIDTLLRKYGNQENYTQKIKMSTHKNAVKEKAIQIINAQRARQEIEANLH